LTAVARDRGQIKLTDFVSDYLSVGWADAHRDREAAITVRNLLSMTSGLTPRLSYEAEPGTRWRYNTTAYSKMVPVLEAATHTDIRTLTLHWLTKPTGMKDTQWSPRPWAGKGVDANAIGYTTSARDLARFGLLILADGSWNGKKLLKDPKYLHEALQPSQDLNPSYGFLWWLNGQKTFRRGGGQESQQGPLVPQAPDDMVAALGALGRKCYVVPSRGLVITRLGDDPGAAFDRQFWGRLLH
jgi:CubicO group peptidase (beta-lactamase class C family)